MKYLAVFIPLLIAGRVLAQPIDHILYLEPVKQLAHIKHLPFDKVVVFDNRFNSSFSIAGDGVHDVYVRRLDSPAAPAIQKYIEAAIAGIPNDNRTLYVSIKQFRFENFSSALFFFSADAYFREDKGFRKIASIKKYMNVGSSFRGNYYTKKAIEALNTLMLAVNKNYIHKIFPDNRFYAIDEVNTNVTRDWAQLNIMKQRDSTADGVYPSIADLRNNNAIPAKLLLQTEPDSSYALYFGDKPSDRRWGRYFDIYAIRYHGTLYIRIMDKFFLPVTKSDNGLCFHVPFTMPNMYAINAARQLGVTDNTLPNHPTNIYTGLLTGIVNIALKTSAYTAYDKTQHQITNIGLADRTMRDCFLDMDTGDAIY